MNNETNELMDYLFEIAQKSLKGDIPWNQPNPSTYQWIQNSDKANFLVTIQRAGLPKSRFASGVTLKMAGSSVFSDDDTYLFQVQNRTSKQTVMSLSTKERPEVAMPLKEIFHGAEKGMDVRASSVLRELLGK